MLTFTNHMTSRPKLSVGIPAHNEEKNIRRLLQSVLDQDSGNFELVEIIVASDGSTDRTMAQAMSLDNPKIILMDGREREGQYFRQNEVLKIFTGDYLLLLNADVVLPDRHLIAKLLEPFANPKVGIVCPQVIPLPAENFFERVINYSVRFKTEMYENFNAASNILLCHGRARLIRGSLARQLVFPNSVSEDAYSYVACLDLGYEFFYQKSTQVNYRSPQTLADHLSQSKRYFKGKAKITTQKRYRFYYKIPSSVALLSIGKYFLLNPTYFLCYLSILSLSIFLAQFYHPSTIWEEAVSSKNLDATFKEINHS
jgi:cellulose synthase/poly-beta-1,6-N-acetylglucosamine synthase-like glycosyltransferase